MSVLNNAINAPLPISATNGGTGLMNPTAHGILVAEGSSALNPIVLTNGQLLIGSTGADPLAATLTSANSTIAFTTGAGSLSLDLNAPVTVAYGGTGLTSITAHGILVGEGTSAVNPIVLTNGQLLIGSTGADPVAAQLTAGTGISIADAAGSITISATGMTSWVNITGTTQALAVNTNYVANNVGLVTATLPTTAAFGSVIQITAAQAGGFTVAQNSGQSIVFGDDTTTVGTGGSLASTKAGDSVSFVCITANTTFQVLSSIGNLLVS